MVVYFFFLIVFVNKLPIVDKKTLAVIRLKSFEFQ